MGDDLDISAASGSDPQPRVLQSLLQGPATIPELSLLAGVPARQVTDIVDAMVTSGMVLRHEPRDNGIRVVSLSKVGLHAALHGRVAGW